MTTVTVMVIKITMTMIIVIMMMIYDDGNCGDDNDNIYDVQMRTNLPSFLSTLAYFVSSAGSVIVQLYVHVQLYANVVINWLLSNVLVCVSVCVSHVELVTVMTNQCVAVHDVAPGKFF